MLACIVFQMASVAPLGRGERADAAQKNQALLWGGEGEAVLGLALPVWGRINTKAWEEGKMPTTSFLRHQHSEYMQTLFLGLQEAKVLCYAFSIDAETLNT